MPSTFSLMICAVTVVGFLLSPAASFNWQTSTMTTHPLKRLSPGVYCTGRLTTRQLGYMSEAGFGSVLSLSNFPSAETKYNSMTGKWPSTTDEKSLLDKYGLAFTSMAAELTVDSYQAVFNQMVSMPKPVLVESEDGWLASLFAQMYLAQVGALDAGAIYSSAMAAGWDFQSDDRAVHIVNAVFNQETEVIPATINQGLAEGVESYAAYYWPHRLGDDNWYTLGQILDTQLDAIRGAGYKTVISFRADGEGTNRLSWEPQTGPVANGEFSDANGLYNVTAEEELVTAAGMIFFNLPVAGDLSFTKEQFDSFIPVFEKAAANGPVLVHCASGYRSAVYALSFIAKEVPQERCVDWAITQARRVGESLDLSESDIQKAVGFWRETLAC